MNCQRCGEVDWIDRDGPPVCRRCLRSAVSAAARPELLSEAVVRMLELQHGDMVLLGFEPGPRGTLRKAWRWVGP